MTWIAVGLAFALVGQSAVYAWLATKFLAELRSSHRAALQANNLPDAARTFAQVDTDARRRVEAQLEAAKEAADDGGVFSAANPFGNTPPKPIGV